jgi:hypothetical protein
MYQKATSITIISNKIEMTIHKSNNNARPSIECPLNGILCMLWFWYIFFPLDCVFRGGSNEMVLLAIDICNGAKWYNDPDFFLIRYGWELCGV